MVPPRKLPIVPPYASLNISSKKVEEPTTWPSWSDYFDSYEDVTFADKGDTFRVYSAGDSGELIILLHGAGHTSMSWALTTASLKKSFRVATFDCRGHGQTHCVDDLNLEVSVLREDAINVIKHIHGKLKEGEENTPIIIAGHSMGGAIAAHIASSLPLLNLKGLIMLDVVEGTAMAAIPSMVDVLNRYPTSFESLEAAVEWAIRSRLLSNRKSAILSIPSQLIEADGRWRWRCELIETQQYWKGWFRGTSKSFLSSKCAKLLICVGHDRLDTEMTIAHMQGKFQLKLVADSGHLIEEDRPEQVADIISAFVRRYCSTIATAPSSV